MIRFTIGQDELYKALIALSRLTNKTDNDILKQVKIEKIDDNNICLFATNTEMAISYRLEAVAVEGDGVCYKLSDLLNIVSRLNGNITIHDGQIFNGKNKLKLPVQQVSLYPNIELPKIDNEITIDGKELCKMIQKTIYACSDKGSTLNGIKFNNTEIAATDGNRLAINKISVNTDLIVPKNTCDEVIKLFNNSEIVIGSNNNKITFKNDSISLSSATYNGKYPNYQQLLPTSFDYKLMLAKADLYNAINILVPVLDQNNRIVKLNIEKRGVIKIEVNNQDYEGMTEFDVCKFDIKDDISIKFKADFILDMLKSFDDHIEMKFNSNRQAVVFEAGNNYSMVMPII